MGEVDLGALKQDAAVLALEGEPGVSRAYFTARFRLIERLPDILAALERAARLEAELLEVQRLLRAPDRLPAPLFVWALLVTDRPHLRSILGYPAALAPTPAGKPCPDCEGNQIRGCSSCNGTGFAPTPAECPRCGSPKPELHPAVQADGGEVSPCSDPFHASSADGRRILANLPAAPTPAEEGRDGG